MICPCCSQKTGRIDSVWLGPFIQTLGPNERTIYEMLARQFGRAVPSERIIDAVWGQHRDGGPVVAGDMLKTYVTALRKKIVPYGLQISKGQWHHYTLSWSAETGVAEGEVMRRSEKVAA